jgi:hypothetical protein
MIMRTDLTVFLAGLVVSGMAGLAWSQDQSAPSNQPKLTAPREAQSSVRVGTVKAAANLPVIGYIEKRDRTITIKAGPKGPVYSVKTADGRVLFENLSKEQLIAQAPELAAFLNTAVAGKQGAKANARARIVMDASARDFGKR